jgi:phage gp29-like protein
LKDWLTFVEVFGMPVRIARYDPSASVQEKRELLEMLRSLGSDAAGVFSKAVELEIVEANRGTPAPPYESLVNFLNREMTKAWLGQTLTVDLADQGSSLAAAEVHDRVRLDIRQDDIRREGRTIRRDILRPLVQFKFGLDAPVPFFRRKLSPPRDLKQFADVLAVAVKDLGVRIPPRWLHDTLGIPQVA